MGGDSQAAARSETARIDADVVRADFNDLTAVVHYARASHELGLWESERKLIERFFPSKTARLLELGCGAGRVTLGLWGLGFRRITGIDFADQLIDQARALAAERNASRIVFHVADATRLPRRIITRPFEGILFMFNGLMQIPGRENRRAALREALRAAAPGAPLLFTTHDRDESRAERALWRLEEQRWREGRQDPRFVEFGDRYFEDEAGRTFMHLPNRQEILEDLAATGWRHEYDEMRRSVAMESKAVRDFSDECRFWLARAPESCASASTG